MITSGEVADYSGNGTRDAILQALATAAGLPAHQAGATITLQAASVRLEVTLPVANATLAAAASQSLRTTLNTAAAATALFHAAGLDDVSVETVPNVSSITVAPPLPVPPEVLSDTTQGLRSENSSSDTSSGVTIALVALGLLCVALCMLTCYYFVYRHRLNRKERPGVVFTRQPMSFREPNAGQQVPSAAAVSTSSSVIASPDTREIDLEDRFNDLSITPTSDYADSILESRLLRARRNLISVLTEMRARSEQVSERDLDGAAQLVTALPPSCSEGDGVADCFVDGLQLHLAPSSSLDVVAASVARTFALGRVFSVWSRSTQSALALRHSESLSMTACTIYQRRQLFMAWMVWAHSALDWSAENGRLLQVRRLFMARQALRAALRQWHERCSTPQCETSFVVQPRCDTRTISDVPSMRV